MGADELASWGCGYPYAKYGSYPASCFCLGVVERFLFDLPKIAMMPVARSQSLPLGSRSRGLLEHWTLTEFSTRRGRWVEEKNGVQMGGAPYLTVWCGPRLPFPQRRTQLCPAHWVTMVGLGQRPISAVLSHLLLFLNAPRQTLLATTADRQPTTGTERPD